MIFDILAAKVGETHVQGTSGIGLLCVRRNLCVCVGSIDPSGRKYESILVATVVVVVVVVVVVLSVVVCSFLGVIHVMAEPRW